MERYSVSWQPDGRWYIFDDEQDGKPVTDYREEAKANRICRTLNAVWEADRAKGVDRKGTRSPKSR